MYPVALAGAMGLRLRSPALWTLVLAVAAVAQAASPPLVGGALKPCANNSNLNQCIVDSLNEARPKLKYGVPAAGLPALDELHGKEVRMEEGTSDANLRVVFRNFTWRGLDDFVATAARADLNSLRIEIDTVHGRQYINGKYMFRGSVLTLRVNGDGDFAMYLACNITHRLQLEEVQRNGETFWRAKEYVWDMDMTELHCDFKNLFNGNKRLGLYANSFINKNWRAAFLVYRELINQHVGRFIKNEIVDNFFEKVPVKSIIYPE